MADTVEFAGESFLIADRIGLMPLMRFAKVAKAGTDSTDLAGLAAMYDLLEQCIAPEDWQRFQDRADAARSDSDELLEVVSTVIETLSARPTSRPSDSSAGPQTTAEKSTPASSSAVKDRLEAAGRPDLALMVTMAQTA